MEAALKRKGELIEKHPQVIVRENAIGIYAEAHSGRYNSSSGFLEFLYGGLGTDGEEMKGLGIDLSDIL